MKQKFKVGDYVHFKHTMFSPAVYWTVINPKPDALGQIVIKGSRSGEYNVVFQDDLKRLS